MLRESWEAICIGLGYVRVLLKVGRRQSLKYPLKQSFETYLACRTQHPAVGLLPKYFAKYKKQWLKALVHIVKHSCGSKLPRQEKYEQPCSFLFFRILYDLYMPVPLTASRTTMQESLKNGIHDHDKAPFES